MAKPEKIVFILNPKSGRKKKTDIRLLIEKHLDTSRFEPVFFYTEHPGHATNLVYECINQGTKHIVAVGGDGTVNEIASAMVHGKASLGIIPKGSGNGLARSLGIPMDTVAAIKCINESKTKKIDAGLINDKYFFCTCGTGFDAKIGHKFAKSKKRGFLSYVKTTIKEFRTYQPKKFKLKVDGTKLGRRAFLVTVANAGQYGNNAYISPNSKMNDGKFELCIFKPFPSLLAPILGLRLFTKKMDRSKYVEIIKAEKIVFRRKRKYSFHIDGEPVKFEGPVKVSVIPKVLKVVTPKLDKPKPNRVTL